MTLDAAVLARYKQRGILVDSSLLLVYLIGSFDRRQLINCRAIKSSFTDAEFNLLAEIIGQFDIVITTPHVLTEVSNLAGKLPYQVYASFRGFFAQVISSLTETNIAAVEIASAPNFVRFGITDTAITLLSPGACFVLTEEAALYGYLVKRGVDALNFNYIRLNA